MYCDKPVIIRKKKKKKTAAGRQQQQQLEKAVKEMLPEFMPNGMRCLITARFDHAASLRLNIGRH